MHAQNKNNNGLMREILCLTMSVAKDSGKKLGRIVKIAVTNTAVPNPSISLRKMVYGRKTSEGSRSESLAKRTEISHAVKKQSSWCNVCYSQVYLSCDI